MRKYRYEAPEVEIIRFTTVDVIEVSGSDGSSSTPGSSEESWEPELPWDNI